MEFGWEFASNIRIFLSIVCGFLVIFGASVWFSYDQKEDPKEKLMSCVKGWLMMIIGFAILVSYHYANKENKLPEFMYLYEPAKKEVVKKDESDTKKDSEKSEGGSKVEASSSNENSDKK